jgi:hypothetical protein
MADALARIKTRDILAVMIVGAALIFNGISLATGRPLDPTSVGFAGIVVGYYFGRPSASAGADDEEPLPEPVTGDESQ